MKKINILLALALVAFMGMMTSCGDDTAPVGPTLSFFSGADNEFIVADKTVEPGASLMFSFNATKGDANLTSLNVTKDGVDLSGYPMEDVEKDNYTDTITITADMNEAIYVYVITIEDKDGETASKTFNITVEAAATAGPITTYTAKLLGGQSAAAGSYFSTTTGEVISSTETAKFGLIDFGYHYNGGAILLSPVTTTYASRFAAITSPNATKIQISSMPSVAFDAIVDDTDFDTFATTGTEATGLSVGSVVKFETAAGKIGLIKVTDITGAEAGSITIDVKVQQ